MSQSTNTTVVSADLFETAQLSRTDPSPSGCCGGPPKSAGEACCALDEEKKAQGSTGCGCSAPAKAPATRKASCC